LGQRPNLPSLIDLGVALHRRGDPDAAIACFREAIALRPDDAAALYNLGTVLSARGETEAAIDCLRRAHALRPGDARIAGNLGSALCDAWRPAEATACLRSAIALRPDDADAHGNLGVAWLQQDRPQAAEASLRAALALRPGFPEAHNNLGIALGRQGRLEEALACYRAAIAARPDHADAHANLAIALLTLGELAAGWPELEWRWRTRPLRPLARGFAQPQWRGEPAAGATLLIHAEQGFGDTLQFCRYAALAAARGLRVVMEVQPPLLRLLDGLAGTACVLPRGAALPAFDLHCPMLSLPLALGTALDTIPSAPAYLAAQVPAQAGGATQAGPGLRVGLTWAGDPRRHTPSLAAVDRRRSVPPPLLAPLAAVPGVQWVSLQQGGPPAPFPLLDRMADMTDFADTAALIAGLDLVISVDTAVVHLAAALGRETWLLDRFDGCWRWLRGRRDSPWYPGLRIYRQPAPGDWPAVMGAVAADLGARAGVQPDHTRVTAP
jgi:Tfp pilus assembly protein PilF